MVFPVPPPDDLAQTPSQPAAPVTPLKPTTATQNPPEQHGLNQGQQLPQTSVVDTPSGGFLPLKMGEGGLGVGKELLEKLTDKGKADL